MYRNLTTIPERLTMKARFAEYAMTNVSAQVLTALRTFQTSMFTPQVGYTHQPMYFDQMMYDTLSGKGLYQKYKVWGIKYRFTLFNNNTNESGYFGVMHQDTSTPETNLVSARERGTGKWRTYGSVNGGHARCVISGFLSTHKALGISKNEVRTQDAFSGTVSTNPTKMAYLIPYMFSQLSSGQANYSLHTDLTYYMTYYDRAEVAQS